MCRCSEAGLLHRVGNNKEESFFIQNQHYEFEVLHVSLQLLLKENVFQMIIDVCWVFAVGVLLNLVTDTCFCSVDLVRCVGCVKRLHLQLCPYNISPQFLLLTDIRSCFSPTLFSSALLNFFMFKQASKSVINVFSLCGESIVKHVAWYTSASASSCFVH